MHTQGPWIDSRTNEWLYEPQQLLTKTENALLMGYSPDLYDALWAAVELSDRTLPPSGRTPECQRVYDQCVAALNLADGGK